eukprot:12925502-Prorocentrum_lima.AAC.1
MVSTAAWDAMTGLQLPKLEYQGRQSRAESFAAWKDSVTLGLQSAEHMVLCSKAWCGSRTPKLWLT